MPNGTCSLDDCDDPVYCRGWCKIHYSRWHRTGDPRLTRKKPNGTLRADLEAAGWADTDECILLAGYKYRPGFNLAGTQMTASRAAWIIAHGDPGDRFVLHTCHRGEDGCINVRHMYLGDQASNIADMDRAGRASRGHGRKLLTPRQVEEIRRRHIRGVNHIYRSNTVELAEEYGVSKATITGIVSMRRWRSVDADDNDDQTVKLGRAEAAEADRAATPAGAEG